MAEIISKQKMQEILSPKNKDERQKRQLLRDMALRRVDIKDRHAPKK